MSYYLSLKSKLNLIGVKPPLVRVVKGSIIITDQDYAVFEGVRSEKRQRHLVDIGASTTMNSRHLTGHAVDLVPYVPGMGLRWDWPLCYGVARSMRASALHEGVELTWGGVWDRPLNVLSEDMEMEVAKYVERRRKKGQRSFIDGPHYQLSWEAFPL